jgi:DNA-binding CsgD family transcriptional regulator
MEKTVTRAEIARRTKAARALARKLEALGSSDAREIRMAVMRTVREAADGVFAVFHDVIESDGQLAVSDVLTEGPCDAVGIEKALRAANNKPLRVIEFVEKVTCFSSPRHVFPSREAFVASDVFQKAFKPYGVHDLAGLIVYHAQTLVGAVTTSFAAPREFVERDREILQPLVLPVQNALTAAHCLLREGLPDEPAYLLARADGRFEHTSARAEAWTRRDALVAAIRRRIRELDRGREPKDSNALEQAEARVVRLDTLAGVRYLVCLRPAPMIRRSGRQLLTPLQLRIATAAANGATVAEIARDTGRGVETVREHLATTYRKLGVTKRIELARALRDHK